MLFRSVLSNFVSIEMENGIMSILFALIGAAVVLFSVARKSQFAVTYVPLNPVIGGP